MPGYPRFQRRAEHVSAAVMVWIDSGNERMGDGTLHGVETPGVANDGAGQALLVARSPASQRSRVSFWRPRAATSGRQPRCYSVRVSRSPP